MYFAWVHLCYVDESGNDQVLDRPDAAPVLVIAGIIVAEAKLKALIWGYLDLKKRFIGFADDAKLSEIIRTEIKGSDLRADLRSGKHRRERRAMGILHGVMDLLELHHVSLVGQVWVKCDGEGVSQGFYPGAIARLAADFQSQLVAAESRGLMVLDARTKYKNVPSVNGITTRKFKTGGDELDMLAESPVFGHSDAHVALQIADIVASALLFPMACLAYCHDLTDNAHPHENYAKIRDTFGARVKALEYWYARRDGERGGGVGVRDRRGTGRALDLYVDHQVVGRVPRERRRTRYKAPVDGGAESESA